MTDIDEEADESDDTEDSSAESDAYPTYDFEFHLEPKGILCRCTCEGRTEEWRIPKTVVHRPKKAVSIGAFFDRLSSGVLDGYQLGERFAFDEEFLLVPRAVNALIEQIAGVIRRAQKASGDMVRIELPPKIREILAAGEPHGANRLALGGKPDRVRLEFKQAAAFLKQVQPKEVIFEGLTGGMLQRVLGWRDRITPIVALPPIFFEEDVREMERLVEACAKERVTVEVNSWGGWRLAKDAGRRDGSRAGLAGAQFAGGAIFGQLGHEVRHAFARGRPAAVRRDRRPLQRALFARGLRPSAAAFDAREDARKFAGRSHGRPPRRESDSPPRTRTDRLSARRTVRSPRSYRTKKSACKHLVVDLVGSNDPLGDWYAIPDRRRPAASLQLRPDAGVNSFPARA